MSASIAKAFRTDAAWIDLSTSQGLLRITGVDAAGYLQRMVSADLRLCTEQHGLPCTLMTHKGKLIGAFDIYRDRQRQEAEAAGTAHENGGFLVVAESCVLPIVEEHLQKFIILEQVAIERHLHWSVASLQGPNAGAHLQRCLDTGVRGEQEFDVVTTSIPEGELLLCRRQRSLPGGWDVLGSPAALGALRERLGVATASASEGEPFRIEIGLPRFGIDATAEHLAPEAGFDTALSYDKGCYAGQEVVARIRTYGHVNKALRRLRVAGKVVPAPGDAIFAEADHEHRKKIGYVTSAAWVPQGGDADGDGEAVALGYVRLDGGDVGSRVRIVGAVVGAVVGSGADTDVDPPASSPESSAEWLATVEALPQQRAGKNE